jgi:hypothetical protein
MENAWKSEDAELDKLLAQMKSATGDEKITAMAALVTKLVELHKKHHEDMIETTGHAKPDALAAAGSWHDNAHTAAKHSPSVPGLKRS